MEIFKRNRTVMVGLFIIYEGMILFLLMAAIIPKGLSFFEFWENPILNIQKVDQYAIALALALFLPLVYRKIDSLKIGAAEVKLRNDVEDVKDEIKEVKQSLSDQRFDYDRALFAIISRLNRQLEPKLHHKSHVSGKTVLQIGALDFAESWITAEIVYQHLRLKNIRDKHDEPIELKPPDSRESTLMTFFNLLSGKTDFFIWYSGTGMAMAGMGVVPHDDAESGRRALNQIYEQWGLKWLPTIGFENKEGPVMLRETAHQVGITSMRQLAEQADKLTFGANREYFLRGWAYPRLKGLGVEFKGVKEVDINDRLSGLFNKEFDVGIIYDTDPENKDHRLTKIAWEEPQFPPIHQYAMPLCRIEHAQTLQEALDDLKISAKEMTRMKYRAKRGQYDDLVIKGLAKKFFE
ncbi:MAG: glycine betaine ABC transporter substrate-binding protein [Desulfobacterales bacterium]|jgi:glycine betaine/choline ABC-type transport system substrate-binding protein